MSSDAYEDAIVAAVDLVGRTGARGLEFGYLDDPVPGRIDWYAHAQYAGARVTVEHQRGPLEAVETLAHRLLTGARCVHCGGLVALSDEGAVAYVGPPWPPVAAHRAETVADRPRLVHVDHVDRPATGPRGPVGPRRRACGGRYA